MNPEDFNYFQSRVSRFITGSNRRSSSGSFLSPRITRLSGIIPKRALPSQIFSRPTASADDAIESSGRGISSLGRVTLDLEIINNNLDRIRQIIEQDYKNTQETNRKETEDFRKRVANRGRIFGRRELGDKKSDVLGSVKKYVGSFFSGTGGAIRALAMFNLLQGILSGDPSKIIGPLLGIGLTYIPAIATGIAGAVATSLVGKMFGGGGARAAATAAPAAAGAGAGRFSGMRGLAGRTALIGGGLALANSIFNRPQEDTQQQRLSELTQEQKGLTDPQNLVPIPQDDLKKFENLNKKFEAALDFLMSKKGGSGQQQTSSRGGGPTPTGQPITGPAPAEINALMSAISGGEGGDNTINTMGDIPGLSQMTIDQAIAKVEQLRREGKTSGAMGNMQQMSYLLRDRAIAAGLDPATALYSRENQYLINRSYLSSLFSGGEQEIVNMIKSGKIADVVNKLKGVWPSLPGGSQENVHTASFYQRYENFFRQLSSGSMPSPSPVLPSPTAAPRAQRSIPAPQRQAPNVTLVPVDSGNQTPSSVASPSNDSAISVDTTHPENFLALYSKLTYQVV
jgi:muramidase (phage lysozyme)